MSTDMSTDLPSHASPLLAPQARPSAQYFSQWGDLQPSGPTTPGLPDDLVSPAFTPPATPGTATPSRHLNSSPKSTPVDTSATNGASIKGPRLVQRLPKVECVVRARIPTTAGAEMFLHLYQNDSDDKEHLAIVFGNNIRSRTLDAEREGESEMDRMIRGAYVGRLRPGRVSSRVDALKSTSKTRSRAGSSLKNEISVQSIPEDAVLETPPSTNGAVPSPPTNKDQDGSSPSVDEVTERLSELGIPQSAPRPPLVRIHSECYTGETAWSARCDCGEQLDEAARLMSMPSSTGGVVVYLRQEGRGIGLASKLMAYNLQDLGNDTVEANLLLRHPADARTYGLATAILVDLGLGTDSDETKVEQERGIRLLTNNPEKVVAVEGPEREVRVRERVAMVPLAWKTGGKTGIKSKEVEQYLATKITKMAHMISEAS